MLPRFKAIDNETGVMLRVLSIDLEFDYIIGLPFKEEARDTFGELIIEKRYYFEDIELLQSTGLFDKNGKEIFEGDIIHYKIEDKSNDGSPYTLRELTGYIYKEGNCMWVKVNDSEIVPLWCLEDQYVIFKILGNIYEHPHLLGED